MTLIEVFLFECDRNLILKLIEKCNRGNGGWNDNALCTCVYMYRTNIVDGFSRGELEGDCYGHVMSLIFFFAGVGVDDEDGADEVKLDELWKKKTNTYARTHAHTHTHEKKNTLS